MDERGTDSPTAKLPSGWGHCRIVYCAKAHFTTNGQSAIWLPLHGIVCAATGRRVQSRLSDRLQTAQDEFLTADREKQMAVRIELALEGITSTGEAVGRHPQTGKAVIVADAIPGERVEVDLTRGRAQLHRVLVASPDRVTPPCPYFGPPQPVTLPDGSVLNPDGAPRCAGCQWQHIAYDRQLALKRELAVQALAEQPLIFPDPRQRRRRAEALVADVVGLGDPAAADDVALAYGYLTQMAFALNESGQLCLPTRQDGPPVAPLLPVDFCLLHHPQLADLFAAFDVDPETGRELATDLSSIEMSVGATADQLGDGHKGMIVLESRSGAAPSLELGLPVNVLIRHAQGATATVDLLVGDWSYPIRLGDEQLTAYPSLGNTPTAWPHGLGDEAIGTLAAGLLELKAFEHGVHLWAGLGLISLVIGGEMTTLVAVEEAELAVAALQANLAGAPHIDIHSGAVRRVLDNLRRGHYETDVALLTPQDGDAVDATIFHHLALLKIGRFGLVCEDSAELARLVGVAHGEGYALTTVQPVDLHPQQAQIVLIARFDRIR